MKPMLSRAATSVWEISQARTATASTSRTASRARSPRRRGAGGVRGGVGPSMGRLSPGDFRVRPAGRQPPPVAGGDGRGFRPGRQGRTSQRQGRFLLPPPRRGLGGGRSGRVPALGRTLGGRLSRRGKETPGGGGNENEKK